MSDSAKGSSVLGTLSICRRAGKLVGGTDEVKNTVKRGEARLVILTSDVSEKSRKDMAFICERHKTAIATVPETMFDIAEGVGKRYGVMAITDKGFAQSILKKLSQGM